MRRYIDASRCKKCLVRYVNGVKSKDQKKLANVETSLQRSLDTHKFFKKFYACSEGECQKSMWIRTREKIFLTIFGLEVSRSISLRRDTPALDLILSSVGELALQGLALSFGGIAI